MHSTVPDFALVIWLHSVEPGVAQDQEIRAVADTFYWIIRITLPIVRGGGLDRGQMSTRREPHNPNSVGRQLVGLAQRSNQPDRPLSVEEWKWEWVIRAQPVFQHKSRDPAGGKPICYLPSFEIAGPSTIGSSWRDDDARTIFSSGVRHKHS